MRPPPTAGLDVAELLERVEGRAPIEAVEAATEALAEMLDARELAFLIADFAVARSSASPQVRVAPGARTQAGEQAETAVAGHRVRARPAHPAGRCPRGRRGGPDDRPGHRPGDAIGLLEAVLPALPGPALVASVGRAAHAMAYVVIAARRYTDVFAWGQRTTPFALAAEIQRRLLPASYTCEAGQFTLAGWLEPSASVGGDTCDYTLNRDSLHVSITDAVGHQIEAALLATLFVGSLRNARRRGLDLQEQARYANDALAENAPPGRFVTGQLVRFDLLTQRAEIVNGGHELPLRLRDGRVEEIQPARGTAVRRPARRSRSSCSPSRWNRAIGSSSSPTACRSGTRRPSTSPPPWPPRRPPPPGGRPRARRRRPGRHRRRPPRRRHAGVPRLVRRRPAGAEQPARLRCRSGLPCPAVTSPRSAATRPPTQVRSAAAARADSTSSTGTCSPTPCPTYRR